MRPVFPGAAGAPVSFGDRADIIQLKRFIAPQPDNGAARPGRAQVIAFPVPDTPAPQPAPTLTVWDRLRVLIDRAERASRDRRANARDRAIQRAFERKPSALPRRQF